MKKKTLKDKIEEHKNGVLAGICGLLAAAGVGLCFTIKYENEHFKAELDYKNLPVSVQGLGGNTEDYLEAMNRVMNLDQPAVEDLENFNTGLGFYTTIDAILGRRLPDGNNDDGKGWQCSRYTAWLGTGQWSYNYQHPDYGPVNGKDVAQWLVDYYDYKYIDKPVEGAIGSGGFNTKYGHTVMYLYSTGQNTAMVNDANFVPLTVATHNMNIEGWVWVVPSNYEPTPTPIPPAPEPPKCDIRYVNKGDTMSQIMMEHEGYIDWTSMNDYALKWHSIDFKLSDNVYDGWISKDGVGLFAGDTIEYCP